jgi:hypothetical protein
MKTLIALAIGGIVAAASCGAADLYSMEATISLHKQVKQYEASARVCRLVDRRGHQAEEVVSRPRVMSSVGSRGSFYVGCDRSSPDYKKLENVSMDVFWPEDGEAGYAICTITVKRGDRVVAKSKMQVTVGEK